MKTSLEVLSLVLAASVPSALAAEFAGIDLPAALDATTAFGAFVVSLIALTALADYSRASKPLLATTATHRASRRAAHPLAA